MSRIIYKTTNLINGKIYIGQHTVGNPFYLGSGNRLLSALKKYGRKNFKREIIVEGDFNQLLLNELETHYIRLYNSTNPDIGYNLCALPWGGGACGKTCRRKLILNDVVDSSIQIFSSGADIARFLNRRIIRYNKINTKSLVMNRYRIFTPSFYNKNLKVISSWPNIKEKTIKEECPLFKGMSIETVY